MMVEKNKPVDSWMEERKKVERALREVASRMGVRGGRKMLETQSNAEVLTLEVMRLQSVEKDLGRKLEHRNQGTGFLVGAFGIGLTIGTFFFFLWAVGDEMTREIFTWLGIAAVALGIFAVGKSRGKEEGYQLRFKEEEKGAQYEKWLALLAPEERAKKQAFDDKVIAELENEYGEDDDKG